MRKKRPHQNTSPKKKFFLSLPAKDSTLKLSLHTINITLFIPAIKIFISKAAKNDLMHARIFRAQTAMHFFLSKEHYLRKHQNSAQFLENCYSVAIIKNPQGRHT